MISGIILVELVPFETQKQGIGALAKPTIALLGGFSSEVVYRFLRRLTETLESFVRGDIQEAITTREQAAKTLYDKHLAQERLKTANALVRLQQKVNSGISPEEIGKEIEKNIKNLIPTEFEETVTNEEKGKNNSTDEN